MQASQAKAATGTELCHHASEKLFSEGGGEAGAFVPRGGSHFFLHQMGETTEGFSAWRPQDWFPAVKIPLSLKEAIWVKQRLNLGMAGQGQSHGPAGASSGSA